MISYLGGPRVTLRVPLRVLCSETPIWEVSESYRGALCYEAPRTGNLLLGYKGLYVLKLP